MMKMFLVAALFLPCFNAMLTCTSQSFDPQFSEMLVYPKTTNDLAQFSPNQQCVLQINVPQGTSAHLFFNSSIPSDGSLTLVNEHGQSLPMIGYSSEDHFILSPGVKFYLKVNAQSAYMQFFVRWYQVPSGSTVRKISKTDSNPVLLKGSFNVPTTFSADTLVSLLVFPSDTSNRLDLIATKIFDGSDLNGKFLGTLNDFAGKNRQVVSSTNTLTVYTLQGPHGNSQIILAQDYSNTKDIKEYTGVYCSAILACSIDLDASNGPAAFSTYIPQDKSETLIRSKMNSDASLDVYVGAKLADNSNRAASYKGSDIKNHLPQEFHGIVRTYVLSSGIADVLIKRTA